MYNLYCIQKLENENCTEPWQTVVFILGLFILTECSESPRTPKLKYWFKKLKKSVDVAGNAAEVAFFYIIL